MSELSDYQRTLKTGVRTIARRFGLGEYQLREIEQELGLDAIQDEQTVTVRVTVPAGSVDEAARLVSDRVRNVAVPAGWSVDVTA